MANIPYLIEELQLRMNSAAQQNQASINTKMLEILEALAADKQPVDSNPQEAEIADLKARLSEAEEKLKAFAAFDGDGDGRPGGSRSKKTKAEPKKEGE